MVIIYRLNIAGVAELVDAPDSKSGYASSVGSIPTLGTIHPNQDIPERPSSPALMRGLLYLTPRNVSLHSLTHHHPRG